MLEKIDTLKYLAVFLFGAGMFLILLTLFALKKPRTLMDLFKPPAELIQRTRLLLEEIRFELTVPTDYLEWTVATAPTSVDRLNYLATHLRKYVERNVLEYMTQCSYVSKATWLRKTRVTSTVSDGLIHITVYGIKNVVIHSVKFMPSEYAHATVYFKNKVY